MDTELARAQSAELAALLGAGAGVSGAQGGIGIQGGTGVRGGTGARLTPGQRWMLDALQAAPGGKATPAQLIAAHPGRWAGVPVRSATFSLHRTGSRLAALGLVKPGRQMVRKPGGRTQGGPRSYQLTAEGKTA
jgi:hypothetical protein